MSRNEAQLFQERFAHPICFLRLAQKYTFDKEIGFGESMACKGL